MRRDAPACYLSSPKALQFRNQDRTAVRLGNASQALFFPEMVGWQLGQTRARWRWVAHAQRGLLTEAGTEGPRMTLQVTSCRLLRSRWRLLRRVRWALDRPRPWPQQTGAACVGSQSCASRRETMQRSLHP